MTPSRELVTESRLQENLRTSTGDEVSLSRSESDRQSGGQASDSTAPGISSTIAEHSLVLDGNPSGAAANAGTALACPHALLATADLKPDSQSTPTYVPLPTLRPEGSARDATTVTGSEDTGVPRVDARVRQLRVEQDSGVCLAGGRPGEARRQEVGSGEWEVLPPPYQEY